LTAGTLIRSPAVSAHRAPPVSAMVTPAKFIAGEPMNPATNRLAGRE
jgi:hypothetical protein